MPTLAKTIARFTLRTLDSYVGLLLNFRPTMSI